MTLTEQCFLIGLGDPDAMGAEASPLKIKGTGVRQQVTGLMVEALSPYGRLDFDVVLPDNMPKPPTRPAMQAGCFAT